MLTEGVPHHFLQEREKKLINETFPSNVYKIYASALVYVYGASGALSMPNDWCGALVLVRYGSAKYFLCFLNTGMFAGSDTGNLDFEVRLSNTSEMTRCGGAALSAFYWDDDSELNIQFFDDHEASQMTSKAERLLAIHVRFSDRDSSASTGSSPSSEVRERLFCSRDRVSTSKSISAWSFASLNASDDNLAAPRRNLQFSRMSLSTAEHAARKPSIDASPKRESSGTGSGPNLDSLRKLNRLRLGSPDHKNVKLAPALRVSIQRVPHPYTVLEEGESRPLFESPISTSFKTHRSIPKPIHGARTTIEGEAHIVTSPHPPYKPSPRPTRTLSRELTIGRRTVSVPVLTNAHLRLDSGDTVVGQGGFGKVRKATLRDAENGGQRTVFAIKSIILHERSDGRDARDSKRFKHEAGIWSQLKHRNILPFIGIAELPEIGMPACLVSPLMKNGNVRSYLRKNQRKSRLPFLRGIARGLTYLHSQEVIHGDLKGANILVSDTEETLLCDFGLATFTGSRADATRSASSTILRAGSYQWMAPELLKSDTPGLEVSKASDVWAFAMVVVELLTTKLPFPDMNSANIILEIEKKRRPPRPDTLECTDRLWDLVVWCWKDKAGDRPSAEEVWTSVDDLMKTASRSRSAHL